MDTKEGFNSNKLVVNVKQMKEPEYSIAKISLIGVRRQKNGRYASQITDKIRHKKVWLGTFDTVEEASQAYLNKKSEFENEKLRQQGKKERKRIRETTRFVGVHKKNKRVKYISEITMLDTFGDVEEASKVNQCKKLEFNAMLQHCANKNTHSKQGNGNVNGEIFQTESAGGSEIDVPISYSCNGGTDGRIDPHEIVTAEEALRIAKEASKVFNSCLIANVCGTKSSDECNNTTSCNPKDMRSLVGIRRRKSGRYQAVITDPIKHKEVSLGTFDTIEQASHAYLSKKTEFEELRRQAETENKPKKNGDQIQQPESPSVVETLNTTTNCDPKDKMSLVGIRRRKSGRYQAVITDPIKHKEVSLGTFDTIEQASQAYLSKKSEFEKLRRVNKENRQKKNCDQIQQPESPYVVASLDTASECGRAKIIDSHNTTPLIIGAYRRKTAGRYTSEIRHPITKKKIWLGTFGTAEEASHAFQSKKLEFQKLVKAKKQQCMQRKSDKLANVKQGHENVNCELKSFDFPLSNSSNGETVQRIDSDKIGTAEEGSHAYRSKKFYSQSSKKVELQSNTPTESSAGKSQEGQEDDKDLWMGEWVQLPDNTEVMFSLKLGLPIIDNYGYLLGEFSTLDDLSICAT